MKTRDSPSIFSLISENSRCQLKFTKIQCYLETQSCTSNIETSITYKFEFEQLTSLDIRKFPYFSLYSEKLFLEIGMGG